MLWLVRSGEKGEHVDACVSNGFAAVEYPTVGDVRARTPAQVLEETRLDRRRSDHDTLAQRLIDFATKMLPGHYVVTSDGARRQLVFGRVTGPYEWREETPVPGMRHLLPVEWLGRMDWDDLDEAARATLVEYPRTILWVPDTELVALAERAAAGELLPPKAPAHTRRANARTARRAASSPAPRATDRLCPGCGLLRSPSQFAGGDHCRDCAG